jgi:hypothetical protein
MARVLNEDESTENHIVYDSQGEEDVWPESQSSPSEEQKDVLVDRARSKVTRVYGKQGKVRTFFVTKHLP